MRIDESSAGGLIPARPLGGRERERGADIDVENLVEGRHATAARRSNEAMKTRLDPGRSAIEKTSAHGCAETADNN
jgi:hypothetical protein